MAIEFENIYKDRIIDTIQKLLKQNLASIPVVLMNIEVKRVF